ncbi:MAG: hypothetical protein U0Q16_34155 [Bryobacteraceae bacterium]
MKPLRTMVLPEPFQAWEAHFVAMSDGVAMAGERKPGFVLGYVAGGGLQVAPNATSGSDVLAIIIAERPKP